MPRRGKALVNALVLMKTKGTTTTDDISPPARGCASAATSAASATTRCSPERLHRECGTTINVLTGLLKEKIRIWRKHDLNGVPPLTVRRRAPTESGVKHRNTIRWFYRCTGGAGATWFSALAFGGTGRRGRTSRTRARPTSEDAKAY